MSNISEHKALEEYPKETYYDRDVCDYVDVNAARRDGYIKGYDKCLNDVEEFLQDCFHIHPHDCRVVQYDSDRPLDSIDDLIEELKNYISNEY